jgi:hypothetical protein
MTQTLLGPEKVKVKQNGPQPRPQQVIKPLSSIFKHNSNSAISKIAKESLHLPILDKKGRNIFA